MNQRLKSFETLMLPHLDAAYGFACRLMGNAPDAEDVVQEAYLKAFAAFGQYAGGSARGWILAIVRNAAFQALERSRRFAPMPYEEGLIALDAACDASPFNRPDAALEASDARAQVEAALGQLPLVYREVLVLRELQDLSYGEIAEVTGTPVGTVMSRLARARARLAQVLTAQAATQAGGRRREV